MIKLVKYRIEPYGDEFMPMVNNTCYPSYASDSRYESLNNARWLADKQVTEYMRHGIRARAVFQQPE